VSGFQLLNDTADRADDPAHRVAFSAGLALPDKVFFDYGISPIRRSDSYATSCLVSLL
jgi:hypothetical protein